MLYRDLQSAWAKFRGHEDPNAPIGFKHDKRLEHGDEFWALRNVDLEVKEGEILGIIGRNGAGKSTLLKILSQITAPTEGKIKVKGRIASLLEVGTGFHPELTGRENVFLNGAILGMTRKEVRSKFDEIVAFADINEFIDTPVKRYSSGMYVRLAFAVAAHLDPEILIVDEVLAVGDAGFQAKCLSKIKEVANDQTKTVIFVSHNQGAIRAICSRAVLLAEGRIAYSGSPDQVLAHYSNEGSAKLPPFYEAHIELESRKNPFIRRVTLEPSAPEALGPLTISFDITVPKVHNINAPVFELAFSVLGKQCEPLAQVFSKISGRRFRLSCSCRINVVINKLPLAPGTYLANLWLGRGHEPIDWVQEALRFEVVAAVRDKDYTESRGYPLLIESEWGAEKPL